MLKQFNFNNNLLVFLAEGLLFALLLLFISIDSIPFIGLTLAVIIGTVVLVKKRFPQSLSIWSKLIRENRTAALVFGLILAIVFPFTQISNPYWIQIAIMCGLFVLMALGLNIVVGNAGLACLGYVAFYALGAYTSGLLTLKFGISFWIALPLAGLVAMAFGFLLGLPALRVKGHYLSLITVAFGLVIQQLLINLEGITGGTNGVINIPAPKIGGHSFASPIDLGFVRLPFQSNYYFLVVVLVALGIYVAFRISNSLVGLTWNAMREDNIAAQCYGINLTKNKLWAFAVGAFYGGIAGAVYANMVGFISPENFTYTHSTLVLSMVILGGLDSIPGVVLGAILLTILPEKFRAFEDFRMFFYGIIIVFMLLFKPEGIIPARERKYSLDQSGESKQPEPAGRRVQDKQPATIG
jgi:ABC-type branched-subunit amino acid transport system permease subunit